MVAAWGQWCRGVGKKISVENLGDNANYVSRMKLFDHLGVEFQTKLVEHEEAGRFLPITHLSDRAEIAGIIGSISALLHLDDDPESLAAVQYSVSELLRNVLEHSGSEGGAFVCAHRYTKKPPHRVSIGVADCGQGIAQHLGRAHPNVLNDHKEAIALALRPGITGAVPGQYGTADNAGAGLFITRCISRGTGGYFFICSGNAGIRQRRALSDEAMLLLYTDVREDRRVDFYEFPSPWIGTVVAMEICTDRIAEYEGFFQWIFQQIPGRTSRRRRIKFT